MFNYKCCFHIFSLSLSIYIYIYIYTIISRNAVTVCPPQYETTDQTDLTQDLVIVHSPWKGGYAQNPNVQSRSFKILQQQLSSEAQ